MFNALNSIKIKTLGFFIAVLFTVTGVTVVVTSTFTIQEVGGLEEKWREFDTGAAAKMAFLSDLRDAVGFGGMIHQFKNYVLRMDRRRIVGIQAKIRDATVALTAYQAVGGSDREKAALKAIGDVIARYADNLAIAERMASVGRTPAEIDKVVKIDDLPLVEAMAVLDVELLAARQASAAAVYSSVASVSLFMETARAVVGVVLMVLAVGFFRYLKSRSERNQALGDLAKKTAILEASLNNVDQGISFVDTDLNLVAFNQRFLELLDFPLDRFKPGDPFELFIRYNAERGEYGPGDVDAQVKERVNLAKQFKSHHIERERPDGTVLEIHGNALPDGQDFVTTYSDVTERKRTEQELLEINSHLEDQRRDLKQMAKSATVARDAAEASNRSKSEFLANMGHELRTPLNAVIGFSDMMRNELLGPVGNPQYLSYAGDIHSSGRHLLGLINDILDISKIEAGEMELYEEAVDITQIIRSSLTLVKSRAEDGGVKLENLATGPLPALFADARKIKQIVINLLSNAVKFTPADGTVRIAAAIEDDGSFSILIKDTGIGIAPQDIERVLNPFIQADSALSRKYEGTGLGLPLTKALIEMHQGRFTLTSEKGVGTEAIMRFPASRIVAGDDKDDLSVVA